MEPNSIWLVALLLCAAGALIYVVARYRPLAAKIAGGLMAVVLSTAAGIAIVNDYYGYYQSWSQLSADLSGKYASFDATTTVARPVTRSSGRIGVMTFRGPQSGITRSGLVYLPPQYFARRYAHTQFPVVELLHGTPGRPSDWTVHMGIVPMLNRMISLHEVGPMIIVMPTMSVGRHFQECVNAPGALDDTYITYDVRNDVLAKFRASRLPAEWGVAGYSSGGYCAANLALRHRAEFGAAGILDGYFRPTDGPAAAALHNNPAAEAANDPLLLAAALHRDVRPLPSFWISAGTGDKADIAAAHAFGAALHGVEQTTLYREPGARHNFYAWRPAVPRMLQWMWTQLAPPSLRVQFPITGPVHNSTIPALPQGKRAARRATMALSRRHGTHPARAGVHQ